MKDREILSLLNTISYTEEEIKELETKAIESENTIGEQLYSVKNDKTLRKITMLELTQKVVGKLVDGEDINYKVILLQSYLEKGIHAQWVGSFGTQPVIYLGVFVTNKRIFIFRMSREYKELDTPYIYEINHLKNIIDRWEECSTLVLRFDDAKEISLRPYGKEEQEVLFSIIKYLKESQAIDITPYKKARTIGEIVLIILYILLMVTMVGVLINLML